ncbi:MAG: hypothetical protein ACREVW_14480 [Burkholderiales bacterium]
MSVDADTLPEGAPFAIGEALFAALFGAAALAGATVLDNPVKLSALADGARIVFFEDVSDRALDQAGGVQKRTYTFNVGVINRTTAARRGAHGDYRAAKRVVRAALKELRVVAQVASNLREGDVTYRIENIDVGGGLVLGTFSVDYRDPG